MATEHYQKSLVDSHAQLESWVRRVVLPGTCGRPTPERLKMILEEAPKQFPFANRRLQDVVYLVLNHPPVRSELHERHFVAALNTNTDKLAPETVAYLRSLPPTALKTQPKHPCELVFYGNGLEPALQDAAKRLWQEKWNNYLEITLEAEKKHGLYTWNHLLLKKSVTPIPLGLCWLPTCDARHKSTPSYFHLHNSHGLTEIIGLPPLGSSEWVRALIDLDPKLSEKHIRSDAYHPGLDELISAFNFINDRAGHERKTGPAAWAIFHLVRSYGIWGGGSFLSIPITIGHGEVSRTAVLSICTKSPLSLPDYRDWRLIADVVFRPLIEEEYANMKFQGDLAKAFYGVGHPLKHRYRALAGKINALCLEVQEKLPQDSNIVAVAFDTLRQAESCQRTSELMNFTSALSYVRDGAILRDDFISEEPYPLAVQFPRELAARFVSVLERSALPSLT